MHSRKTSGRWQGGHGRKGAVKGAMQNHNKARLLWFIKEGAGFEKPKYQFRKLV